MDVPVAPPSGSPTTVCQFESPSIHTTPCGTAHCSLRWARGKRRRGRREREPEGPTWLGSTGVLSRGHLPLLTRNHSNSSSSLHAATSRSVDKGGARGLSRWIRLEASNQGPRGTTTFALALPEQVLAWVHLHRVLQHTTADAADQLPRDGVRAAGGSEWGVGVGREHGFVMPSVYAHPRPSLSSTRYRRRGPRPPPSQHTNRNSKAS